MRKFAKIIKIVFWVTLGLSCVFGVLFALERLNLIGKTFIVLFAHPFFLIITAGLCMFIICIYFFYVKEHLKKADSAPKQETPDTSDLSPEAQALFKEKLALKNIIGLIDKHGFNEECIYSLLDHLPPLEAILTEMTKFADFDPALAWDKHCLDLATQARVKTSQCIIDASITKAESERILFEAVELVREAVGEPTPEYASIAQSLVYSAPSSEPSAPPQAPAQPSSPTAANNASENTAAINQASGNVATTSQASGNTATINQASGNVATTSQASQNAGSVVSARTSSTVAARDNNASASTHVASPTVLASDVYQTSTIPAHKDFNSRTQSNLGWGEAYGGISAVFKTNTTASPQQQEMLRRSASQTSHQIIIQQNQDPQVRKQRKPVGKIIAFVALGIAAAAIITFVVLAVLDIIKL